MTTPILGFPEPGQPPPRPLGEGPDSLARRIDAAIAAIEPGRRGRLIFSLTQQRAAVDLMFKIAGPATVVARVAKPRGLPPEAEVLVNVSFATLSPAVKREAEDAQHRSAITFADCYRALRTRHEGVRRNGRFRAVVKALAMVKLGKRPYLDGKEWFE